MKVPVVFGDSEMGSLDDFDPKTTDERTPQDILITGKCLQTISHKSFLKRKDSKLC